MYALTTIRQHPAPNGNGLTTLVVLAPLLVGTGSAFAIGQEAQWQQFAQSRSALIFVRQDNTATPIERTDARTAAEHLHNIRTILNPSMTDLANLFGVSRQAIYKWLSADSQPEPEKQERLQDLSHIADKIEQAGIIRANALLKMKAFDGLSLLEKFATGENCDHYVTRLIVEAKAMENAYQDSGIANANTRPNDDWKSSIAIAGTPKQTA